MKTVTRSGPHTYEDFCALVHEDQKADLIDGVIYLAPPENIDANELFLWLVTIMRHFVQHHQLGLMFLNYAQRLDAVAGLGHDLDAPHLLEQETQLVTGELFVVHDDGAEVFHASLLLDVKC